MFTNPDYDSWLDARAEDMQADPCKYCRARKLARQFGETPDCDECPTKTTPDEE